MSTATPPTNMSPDPTGTTTSPTEHSPAIRSTSDDVRAVPTVLKSELIKLSSLRSNKAILALTVIINGFAAWAVATLVTDEVLTVSEVFVYPALLTAVLAAVAGILLFTSEVQHGTLAITLSAQPARWLVAVCKTIVCIGVGLVLAATGMAAGVAGAVVGGLGMGDTSTMAATTLFALLYIALAALIGLGIGMIARHSAGAISGLLVWWFVGENLLLVFTPAKIARFLPFDAGYRMLDVGSDFDSPEVIAAALTNSQCALVFGGYAAVAMVVGTVLLYRRDTN